MTLALGSQLRIEIMELRIRLELLGARAFDEACQPSVRGRQSRAKHRLLFLLDDLSDDERVEAYKLLRLGAYVMEQSSNILHGRNGLIDLPHVIVEEWRGIVERLEALAPVSQAEAEASGSPRSTDDIDP